MSESLLRLKTPRLGYGYHAEFLDDERTLLLSEKSHVLLTGRLYRLVLEKVKDGIPMVHLMKSLAGKVSGSEVVYAVNLLAGHGYISESHPSLSSEACAFWRAMGMDGEKLSCVLAKKTVCLESVGEAPMDVFHRTFEENGIRLDSQRGMRVVLTREYDRKAIEIINKQAMISRKPWLLVNPFGSETWIGPLFIPGQTGCWSCLVQRLRINRQAQSFYRAVKKNCENPLLPLSFSPMSLQITAGLTAMEVVKWIYHGKNEKLEGRIISLDTASMAMHSHELVKRPQCPVCGTPTVKPAKTLPIRLEKRTGYCINKLGGYREQTAEVTFAEYRRHISPITGVVNPLEQLDGGTGAPVYNCNSGRNIALNSSSLSLLNQHVRRFNIGKGKNWSQARTGALCESIERYSCTWHGDEPVLRASLDELGEKGIHPNACMNFSPKQYEGRDALNGDCPSFHQRVPVPFDPKAAMDWAPVWSVTQKRCKYLPACFCYTQYPSEDGANLYCYPDTNGNAAGNSLEEAVLQGMLELLERDAVAVWWYNRIQRPRVDLNSFDEPYFRQLTEYYASLGRSLYVIDITSDLGIYTFAAISHRLDKTGPREIIFAFGSHVEAPIGIERALLEVNQILHVVHGPERGSPSRQRAKGKYRTQDPHFLDWLSTATMENQSYLAPLPTVPPKRADDYTMPCDANVFDAVMFCIENTARHGLETLVLDMTRPDIGLSVVKVVVPGLRHFWKRLGPGRLYEVPVRMGWLDAQKKEQDLNPVGIFI